MSDASARPPKPYLLLSRMDSAWRLSCVEQGERPKDGARECPAEPYRALRRHPSHSRVSCLAGSPLGLAVTSTKT